MDGRPGEPYDSIAFPFAMSDDGRVIAFAARRGDSQHCVVNGQPSRPYRCVADPAVSRDGSRVAFAASDGGGWFVVDDGREAPKFDWVGNLVLEDRLAYCAEKGGRAFVVADGERGRAFDRVTRPAISGDTVAYGGRRQGRWFLVVDGRETPVAGPVASVFAGAGRAGCVIEDDGYSIAGGPRFEWIGWPTIVLDGRVVYFAARGKTKYVVDGDREIELGDWVVWDPALSPDGRRLAFGAKVGSELWWKVLHLSPR